MTTDDLGSRPVPDPTILTTQQLLRELSAATELFDAKLQGVNDVLAERFASVTTQFRLIEQQRVEQKNDCVEATTPVLCADLIWRPAGQLVVGDELIACDDEAVTEPGRRTPRRFRRGIVTANSLQEDVLFRVTTAHGAVVCNAHHPFLVLRPQPGGRKRYWHWVKTSDLQDGDFLMRAVDVWDVDTTWEGGWLAGMFDGEGSMMTRPTARLCITQRESATADLIEQALKARVDTSRRVAKPWTAARRTLTWDYYVNQRPDVMRLLGSVRPQRLLERADEVWEGQSIGSRNRATPFLAVEAAGRGTIAMLSVSTGTYIAGGFAVHNTKAAVDAALAAAKEAVKEQTTASDRAILKSETATTEQLKQLKVTFDTGIAGIQSSITDLKERVDRGESARAGGSDASANMRAIVASVVGVVLLLAALGGVIAAVVKP